MAKQNKRRAEIRKELSEINDDLGYYEHRIEQLVNELQTVSKRRTQDEKRLLEDLACVDFGFVFDYINEDG